MALINGLSVLNCRITVGDEDPGNRLRILNAVYFKEIVEVTIKDSYSTLVNTATVTFTREIKVRSSLFNEAGERDVTLMGNQNSLFKQGQRIKIELCYGDDVQLKTMFEGYIVSVIANNPFSLVCEDMGYLLKRNSIPPVSTSREGTKINDFAPLLLQGTNLELHPSTRKMNIEIGQVVLEKNHTAADVLSIWKKYGLMSFIKLFNGKPYLAIGRTFFSTNTEESILNGNSYIPVELRFEEHVAGDNLQIKMLDYMLLALEAVALYPDNSMFKVTIRRDPMHPEQFQEINESKLSKKQIKEQIVSVQDVIKNIQSTQNKQDKVDLSGYNVRTYHEYNVSRETLVKNAKAAFTQISQTGIEGDLIIFGDFGLQAGTKVRLSDKRNPEKNGVYVVSEVTTTFGVSGYRQKIKIPYRISD